MPLAQRLVDSSFNLRALVRDICTSRIYQLSAAQRHQRDDDRQFSRSQLRPLAGRRAARCHRESHRWQAALRFPEGDQGDPVLPATPAIPRATRRPFFETFGRSARAIVCSCDTKMEPTLSQTLHMMAGDTMPSQIGEGGS